VVLVVAVGDGEAKLPAQRSLVVGRLVVAVESDGGGVVVQFVERHPELADRVRHDGQRERGDVGVEEAIEAATNAVVVERGELRLGQSQQVRHMACGPRADAVERLTRDQKVLDQNQEPGRRWDARPTVLVWEVAAEEFPEAEPREETVEDRQRGDAAGVQGPAGGGCGAAGGVLWIGLVVRSARLFPHGSVPSTHRSASESGGPSAAISADMVVRPGGRSRGVILRKFLRRYALT